MEEHRRNKGEKENTADLNNYSSRINNNQYIPIDLTAEILSRLPIKSIARFTSVSKSWRDLITSTTFSSTLARNSPFHTILAASSADPSEFYKTRMLIQVSKNGDSAVRANLRARAVNSRSRKLVVGSCNGLLCIVDHRPAGLDRISILNPITNERASVARSRYDGKRTAARYRFGYSPSTNEYKVLRSARHGLGFRDRYAIFTVGVDKKWRKLPRGSFPNYVRDHADRYVVPTSSDGAFHWLAGDRSYFDPRCSFVLAFDVAEEKTRRIFYPREEQKYLRSLVSADPLCLYYRRREVHVVLRMEGGGGGDRWSRAVVPGGACVMLEDGDFGISFVKSLDRAVECGGVLFWVEGGKALRSYCPKSEEDAAIPFRHDEVGLLCGFTPSFSIELSSSLSPASSLTSSSSSDDRIDIPPRARTPGTFRLSCFLEIAILLIQQPPSIVLFFRNKIHFLFRLCPFLELHMQM